MKAFVALMFVAAVSGYTTTGVDRSLYDIILRNRQLYPWGRTTGVLSGLKTDVTGGVYGDMTTGYLPSTQQYNIPSDVTLYTLRQLYTLPVFQEYLTLPFFKQYLSVPAFQRYLVSPYYQQYFTQTLFKQFFVDPVLFYKYIYPVVYQFQTGVVGVDQTLFVPEIYRHLVPEIYRNKVDIYGNGVVPSVYGSQIVPETYYGNKVNFEDILRGILVEGKKVYGNDYVDELLRKILFGQVYGTGVWGSGMNYDVLRKMLLGQVYGNGIYGTGMNYDVLRKILFGQMYGQGVYGPMTTGTWGTGIYGKNIYEPMTTGTWGNGLTLEKLYNTNKFFGGLEHTGMTGIHKVAPVVFDRVFKDLLDGKITIDDIKGGFNTEVYGDKIVENKMVDPITGDIKIVTEKIVKPVVDTIVGGEETLNNDVLLNKMMLKKNTFNKL